MRRGSVSVRRESVGVEERESVVERMGSVRRVRDVERENVRKEKDVDVERRERDVDVERRKDVRVIAVRSNLKRSVWLV